jgi:hypothetical protein
LVGKTVVGKVVVEKELVEKKLVGKELFEREPSGEARKQNTTAVIASALLRFQRFKQQYSYSKPEHRKKASPTS